MILFKLYKALGVAKHQLLISAFGISSHCKHEPTCSRYTEQQIKEHGTITGSIKGLSRLLRCW